MGEKKIIQTRALALLSLFLLQFVPCDPLWMVVLNIFYFHPYLGKWSNLTSIFFKGVETQPPTRWNFKTSGVKPASLLGSEVFLGFDPGRTPNVNVDDETKVLVKTSLSGISAGTERQRLWGRRLGCFWCLLVCRFKMASISFDSHCC